MLLHELFGTEIDEGKLGDIAGAGVYLASLGLTGVKSYDEIRPAPTEQVAPSSVTVGLPDAEVPTAQPKGRLGLSKDAKILALTIWAEARNGGEQAMRAVGHVIKNRADKANHNEVLARRFGHGIRGVALKHNQFSCWNSDDPNREKMREIKELPKESRDYQAWVEAKRIAGQIVAGQSRDPTRGSLYYRTGSVRPSWADDAHPVAKVGGHLFYRDVPLAEPSNA